MSSIAYDDDYYGWTLDQVEKLEKRDIDHLDFDHLIEEMRSLGNSERRALKSHLVTLLIHLLKMQYQSEFKTRSWEISIKLSRLDIKNTLEENPSLKHELDEIFFKAYRRAKSEAAAQTYLEENIFPQECPWTFEEAMLMQEKK